MRDKSYYYNQDSFKTTKDEKIWKVLTDYHKEMVEWASEGYKAKYGTTEITGRAISQLNVLDKPKVDEEKLEDIIWDTLGTNDESERNYQLSTTFKGCIKNLAHEIVKRWEELR